MYLHTCILSHIRKNKHTHYNEEVQKRPISNSNVQKSQTGNKNDIDAVGLQKNSSEIRKK